MVQVNSHLLHTRLVIIGKTKEAVTLIPNDYLPNPVSTKLVKDVPGWHDFEYAIWKIGEEIRLLLFNAMNLRKDQEIQSEFVRLATNRNAKRGRQTFIMLLGYKFCSHHAKEIASQIDDQFVEGHVIMTLRKMQVKGYSTQVRPFLNSQVTWIRNEAKKYLSRFGDV